MTDFYLDTPTDDLRLGDVVTGFPVATPAAHDKEADQRTATWSIRAVRQQHLIVMTPCCSIEDKSLLLAPLSQIRGAFLKNPWWQEDLIRLNRKMPFDKSIPPEHLKRLTDTEKAERSAAGDQYAIGECFVFAPHAMFGTYTLNMKPPSGAIGHYMVDFKSIFRVDCDFVNRPAKAPPGTKLLELSIRSRTDLREKLAHFFSRPAKEDLASAALA